MLIDTHCHLDLPAFDDDRSDVFDRARQAGVEQHMLVAFNPERWTSGEQMRGAFPGVSLAIGLHPNDAEIFNDQLLLEMRATAQQFRAVAIGETGLDYHWNVADPEQQRQAFREQIKLAKALSLPFIVHQRKAAADVLAVLEATDPPHEGVMHCFLEDWQYAERCLALGLHLGIGGAVTHRKATAVHDVVRQAPLDRIVLETDSPYMTPSPHRGERNEPAYLVLIAEKVAELRGVSIEAISAATTAVAIQLFGLRQPRLHRHADATFREPV